MKFRRLGKTNIRVSVVGVGTWQFGGEWAKDFSQADADDIIDAAREQGMNLIDTAECYGDHTSESLVGNAVRRDRERWVIATKFGHRFHGFLSRTDERSPQDAVRQLEASLKALRTDYVDILQYHSIRNDEFDNPELQQTLIKLKEQGKVRHIGNSISPNDNLHQTDASEQAQVEVIQVLYNRLDRKPEQEVFESCRRQNLGVLARVPLASGFLSGKYKPGDKFAADDVRSGYKPEEVEKRLREVQNIEQTEVPAGVPIATWALAWALQHPTVTAVIPGCKTPGRSVPTPQRRIWKWFATIIPSHGNPPADDARHASSGRYNANPKPRWRNWQTHYFEVVAPQGVQVQILSWASGERQFLITKKTPEWPIWKGARKTPTRGRGNCPHRGQ